MMPAMGIEGTYDELPESGGPPERVLPEEQVLAAYRELGEGHPDDPGLSLSYDPRKAVPAERHGASPPSGEGPDDADPDEIPISLLLPDERQGHSDPMAAVKETVTGTGGRGPASPLMAMREVAQVADSGTFIPPEAEENLEADDGSGDSAAGSPSGSYGPEAAAHRNLQEFTETIDRAIDVLAERIIELEDTSASSEDVQGEIEACGDIRFQLLVLEQAIKTMRRRGSSQPAKHAFFLVTQAQTCVEAIEENKREFSQSEIWRSRYFRKMAEKVPWLVPTVAAVTEVREWSAGGALGIPGLVQANFSVTFGPPGGK